MGGHYDVLFSRPTYWTPRRNEGEPLVELHPRYGEVYHLGEPEDLMAMAERENALVSLPHPRSKGSTGYPDAIRDEPHFLHPRYFSLGYRWGMGIDGSEVRLGESRFLKLWDETNNWMAQRGAAPKFALAISEARSDKGDRGKSPKDDVYGMSPVNYVKLDEVPAVEDMSPLIDALRAGDYFVTSGEVLAHAYEIHRSEERWTVVAELEWTFPLRFLEIVWGDGERVGREIVPVEDGGAFGRRRFEIGVDPAGKSWLRFAAWDVAGNGLMTQPVAVGTRSR